jgi:hypothetical protein
MRDTPEAAFAEASAAMVRRRGGEWFIKPFTKSRI